MKLKIFFLLITLSSQVYSLESTDVMEARILNAYQKNILSLNRGYEDGIEPGDHIKLTNENGFVARGVCLSRTSNSAVFKFYRIVNPELLSKESSYSLIAINQSEMPEDIRQKYYKKEAYHLNPISKDRIANSDLPFRDPSLIKE